MSAILTPEQRAQEQYDEDLAWLLKQPHFRRFLMAERVACGADSPVFDFAAPDPLKAAMREGERRFAIRLWKKSQELAPKLVRQAVNESLSLYAEWSGPAAAPETPKE